MGQPSGGVIDWVRVVEVKARRPVKRLRIVILGRIVLTVDD